MAAPSVSASTPTQAMSVEEYWALPDDEGPSCEWVAGRVVVHGVPTEAHQRVIVFLSMILEMFAAAHRLGRVFTAGYRMQAVPGGPVREPDVLFVASQHADRRQSRALVGPADLAVEVVSEDSVARDRAEKFDEYEQAGVREYWVVDVRPGHERADFWVLDEESGKYRVVPIGDDGVYRATVLPGFWLRVSWLRPDGMPDALPAFAEIVGGPSGLVAALRHSQVTEAPEHCAGN